MAAEHPPIPQDVLEQFAVSPLRQYRLVAATHPGTPSYCLDDILDGEEADPTLDANVLPGRVALNVARRNDLPAETARRLLSGGSPAMRLAAAKNAPFTARELLELIESDDDAAALGAAGNPRAAPRVLERLARRDLDPFVQLHVAGNPSTPAYVLDRMARADHADVVNAAAGNPSTPVERLRRLANTARNDDARLLRALAGTRRFPTTLPWTSPCASCSGGCGLPPFP